MSGLISARPIARRPSAPAALGAAAVVAVCLATSWALVEYGPLVAVLPLALALGVAAVAAGLNRPVAVFLVLVAVVAGFPVARTGFGGVPLYATDVLAALAIAAVLRDGVHKHRFVFAVALYLIAWIPAWLYQVIRIDILLEPTYGLGRNLVAVGIAIGAYELARRREDVTRWFAFALAGATAFTAVITIGQALGPTREITREFLVTIAPTFTEGAYRVYPERAFALFAAPTALSGFLAMVLPLIFVTSGIVGPRARILLAAVGLLAGVALIATYSRQWVPALALGLIALAFMRPSAAGRGLLIGGITATAAAFALSAGGLDSAYLNQRFSSLGSDDQNVQTRLDRQRRFLGGAEAGSLDTFAGRGFAGQDIAARDLTDARTTDELREGLSDNSFLLEWFNHGIAAALLYALIVIGVTAAAVRGARRRTAESPMLAALGATLITGIALHFLDNYFSEAIYMKTFWWILIGLTAGLVARQRIVPANQGAA